jgi:hypothetical protein
VFVDRRGQADAFLVVPAVGGGGDGQHLAVALEVDGVFLHAREVRDDPQLLVLLEHVQVEVRPEAGVAAPVDVDVVAHHLVHHPLDLAENVVDGIVVVAVVVHTCG